MGGDLVLIETLITELTSLLEDNSFSRDNTAKDIVARIASCFDYEQTASEFGKLLCTVYYFGHSFMIFGKCLVII